MDRPLCPRCKKRGMIKNGFHKATGKQQWKCTKQSGSDDSQRVYCYSTLDPTAPYRDESKRPKDGSSEQRKPFRRKVDVNRTLVFTAAQNATPVHEGFHATLRSFVADMDAEFCKYCGAQL